MPKVISIFFFFLKQLVQAEAKCQSYIIYNKAGLKKKEKEKVCDGSQ